MIIKNENNTQWGQKGRSAAIEKLPWEKKPVGFMAPFSPISLKLIFSLNIK